MVHDIMVKRKETFQTNEFDLNLYAQSQNKIRISVENGTCSITCENCDNG